MLRLEAYQDAKVIFGYIGFQQVKCMSTAEILKNRPNQLSLIVVFEERAKVVGLEDEIKVELIGSF